MSIYKKCKSKRIVETFITLAKRFIPTVVIRAYKYGNLNFAPSHYGRSCSIIIADYLCAHSRDCWWAVVQKAFFSPPLRCCEKARIRRYTFVGLGRLITTFQSPKCAHSRIYLRNAAVSSRAPEQFSTRPYSTRFMIITRHWIIDAVAEIFTGYFHRVT